MPKVTFNNKNALFFPALKKEVDNYFKENNIRKTGNSKLYLKAIILIPTAIILYTALLTLPMSMATGILLSALLGLTLASVGFNIMHDACHGSYSSKGWVNDLLGLTLNALGGNAYIWKQKHNIIHHTYTNVDGIDEDIAKSPVMRQSHHQPWVPAHRFQHIYVILVYAISSFAWVFIMDFAKYFTSKIYKTPLQKMALKDHIMFWVSKLLYMVFYIAIPIAIVGWKAWAVGFAAMHITLGFTLAIVFQLAHVVEETEFVAVGNDDMLIENEWAIHQLKTTADFAPDNKIVSWFVGGLNFQVEHHLFPRISHVHYPAIRKIVEAKCQEFGVPYLCMPTMTSSIGSHFRFMKELGRGPINMNAQQIG